MKKKIAILGISGMLLLSGVASAAPLFSDLKEGHWAESSVKWGMDNKIVAGYSDGTYKPNENVTEAEFLKMLVSTYKVELGKGTSWYDPYYEVAADNKWVATGVGYNSPSYRNAAITRGAVAKLLASADGKSYTSEEPAVQYLFDNNMSNGKTAKTYEGYKPKDKLTRAEAVKFIKTFVENRKNSELVKAEVEVDNTIPVLLPTVETHDSIVKNFEKLGYAIDSKDLREGIKLTLVASKGEEVRMSIYISVLNYKGVDLVSTTVSMDKEGSNMGDFASLVKVISKDKIDLSKEKVGNTDTFKEVSKGFKFNYMDTGTTINSTVQYEL